jgi:hypothetical protein
MNEYPVLRSLLIVIVLGSCTVMNETPMPANIETATVLGSMADDTPFPAPAELNLKEANVIEVRFEGIDETRFRFDVTLLHDDDGEAPSYADSWHVENMDGDVLGERILTHAHGTLPFTRSATILIPGTIDLVVVRGHDMEHGFGGQAALVNLLSGEISYFDEDTGIIP